MMENRWDHERVGGVWVVEGMRKLLLEKGLDNHGWCPFMWSERDLWVS